jgi:dolichyl-phosphate-mannose--protein O-mannosyl transferase
MWYDSPGTGTDGCELAPCSQAITSIANPLIWWAAVAAALYLVYRLIRTRHWQIGLILMGIAAGYLPWLMYTERTVFQFYTIAFQPYLLLALTAVIGLILGHRDDPHYERTRGVSLVAVFLILATALSAFWYPLWSATTVPFWFWTLHSWIPSWV